MMILKMMKILRFKIFSYFKPQPLKRYNKLCPVEDRNNDQADLPIYWNKLSGSEKSAWFEDNMKDENISDYEGVKTSV